MTVKPAAVAVGVDIGEKDTLDEVVLEDVGVGEDLDLTVYDFVACLGYAVDGSFAAQGIHTDDFLPVSRRHEPDGFIARRHNVEHIVDLERNECIPVERRVDDASGQNKGVQRYGREFFGTVAVEIFGKDIGAEGVTECGNTVAVLAISIADLVCPFPEFFNDFFSFARDWREG